MAGPVVRALRWPGDRSGLAGLDCSFSTTHRVRAVLGQHGLMVHFDELDQPLRKEQRVAGLDVVGAPWQHAYVAELDGTVVGLAGTHLVRWNNRQVLDALYVDAGARRRGVGRALVDAVLGRARQHGARQLWLETQDVNAPAVASYLALGFTVVGLDTTLYAPPHTHEIALYLARPVPA